MKYAAFILAPLSQAALSAREPKLWQCELVVQGLEDDLYAAADLRFRVGGFQQIRCEQRTRRVVELHDDARVRHSRSKSLVTGVVHDRVAVSYTHLRAHETPEHLVCR